MDIAVWSGLAMREGAGLQQQPRRSPVVKTSRAVLLRAQGPMVQRPVQKNEEALMALEMLALGFL